MNIWVMLLLPLALLASRTFSSASTVNCLVQTAVFVVTAQVPAWMTGRMSYVDIAWPYGLVSIGILPCMLATHGPWTARSAMVMTAYLVAGGRMGLGATLLLTKGHLNTEFTR